MVFTLLSHYITQALSNDSNAYIASFYILKIIFIVIVFI